MNIWLYKGQHHFVQCSEHLGYKHGTIVDEEEPWVGFQFNPQVTTFDTLCKSEETFFPLRRSNAEDMLDDNQKYYVRPLDCKLKQKGEIFEDIAVWGPEADFDRFCVDVDAGEKPQVRVHGTSFFNITNFA